METKTKQVRPEPWIILGIRELVPCLGSKNVIYCTVLASRLTLLIQLEGFLMKQSMYCRAAGCSMTKSGKDNVPPAACYSLHTERA